MHQEKESSVFKIVIIYFLIGLTWILLSDALIIVIFGSDAYLLNSIQSLKGTFYIIITALLLYLLVKSHTKKINEANRKAIEGNNRYKNLVNQSSEGICRFEISPPISLSLPLDEQLKLFFEHATLAECNESYAKMYGFSKPEDLSGKVIFDLIKPMISRNKEFINLFVSNNYRISNSETEGIDRNGNKKYFLNNVLGIIENNMIFRIWVIQMDITDLKKAEDALKESEGLYHTVVESQSEGLIITDVEDKILFVNKRIIQMTGYSHEELLGKISHDVFFEYQERNRIHEKHRQRLSDKTDSYETQIVRKDGTKFWVNIIGSPYKNVKGEIIGTIGAVYDLTTSKIAQQLIKESEEKYKSVVEQVREVIFQTDKEKNFIFINPYWTELTGYDIPCSIGKNFEDFIYAGDKETVTRNLSSILTGSRNMAKITARIIKEGGGIRWVEINSHLLNESGSIKGITGTITDIHERKLAEEELIKAKEKAEESDRLKSIFLAQVSHEIRTPLNIIISYNALLQEEMNKIQEGLLAAEFQAIENGSRRLLRTIDLILNMSMLQSGSYDINLETIDLDFLLRRLIYEFKSLLKEKNLELIYKNEIADSRIVADEYTLTEAFQNLIHNAIKYTNAGEVEIRIYGKDNKVNVDVADTGIGISEEYFPKLFTPFSQEDHGYSRKFEGNGLGLALTKKYIDLNNAEISVISRKGKGTTFTISLISFSRK